MSNTELETLRRQINRKFRKAGGAEISTKLLKINIAIHGVEKVREMYL